MRYLPLAPAVLALLICAAAAIAALAAPLSAAAHEQGYGFVFANDPTAASYTPSSTYAYNNDAGMTSPRITRSGTGQYAVYFRV